MKVDEVKADPTLFILAGEQSGDLHAGRFMQAVKQLVPRATFTGVGGPKMRDVGMECLLPMEEFELIGFTAILTALPKVWRQFRFLKKFILAQQPDAVILVDYPGFNLRLAKALRKNGFKRPIIQYISPTVWAWGKGRIQTMAENLDLLLTIFPFEPDLFKHTSLKTLFVGHPLIETLNHHSYHPHWIQSSGFDPGKELIALFPGSRKSELADNLAKQFGAAKKLLQANPRVQLGVSCARPEFLSLIRHAAAENGLVFDQDVIAVPAAHAYDLMRACRTAIAKSGTVTLELALHNKPAVTVYEVSLMNRLIGTYLLNIQLPHFCIVNILAGKEVYPELIRKPYTADTLFEAIHTLNQEGPARQTCLAELAAVRSQLQNKHASQEAAKAILELLP
jgi:lipid-A-disaccharide synthase